MVKKKILLRIDPEIHDKIKLWAEDDMRSINAQIEFLLKKSIREKKLIVILVAPPPSNFLHLFGE